MRKHHKNRIYSTRRLMSAVTGTVIVLASVLIYTSSGLAEEENAEDVVRQLVSQRTDAMNGYFASELSYWEAGNMLRETEMGRLLDEDLKSLKQYFRTDIEQIRSYEISSVEFSYESADLLCAVVQIEWETDGLDGQDSFATDYSVICEKEGERFKLVQFF